jgi:DNA mismatch repair protein MutS2
LHKKEKKLLEDIDSIIHKLMSSRKFMSQLTDAGGKLGPYNLNGRIVVPVRSREGASNIGTIRSNSSKRSQLYVEPKEIIHLGDELASIRNEMSIVENQIINHFSTILARSATVINKGLDVVASIDVIFARAAFGDSLNGCIPHVGENGGVIRVEKFVHPVLAMKRDKTIPIDLFIANNSHDRSLIISGPNAGEKYSCSFLV